MNSEAVPQDLHGHRKEQEKTRICPAPERSRTSFLSFTEDLIGSRGNKMG